MNETVSVCIPAYRAQEWIGEAIESALAQSPAPLEVIVADDGSDDATAALAERYGPPVRVARLPHAGIGAARNACARLARGELIAFLDADDRLTARSLEARLALLREQPALELVFGEVQLFSATCDGEPVALGERRAAQVPAAMLVRAGTLARVGPFREDTSVATDLEWLLRARELAVREATVAEQVVWRRIHKTNHSLANEHARAGEFARALKESLDRRRAAARRAESAAGADAPQENG